MTMPSPQTDSLDQAIDAFFDACALRQDEQILRYTVEDASAIWPLTSASVSLRNAQCRPDQLIVGGIPMEKYAIRLGRMRMVKKSIRMFESCATVSGYIKGELFFPTKPHQTSRQGTWRISMLWTRESRNWKLGHMELADLQPLQYLTYLPKGYQDDPAKKWPLIMFLHGSGQRGSDIRSITTCALPEVLESDNSLPFITICPQCPAELRWLMLHESLRALLEEVIGNLRVDTRRVYLTGNSMGGNGTWSFASQYPSFFAAIAPVCGRTDGACPQALKDMPIWIFHGEQDNVVPAAYSHEFVKQLSALGNQPKVTLYPKLKHDSWTDAYNDKRLYEWFLQHENPGIPAIL